MNGRIIRWLVLIANAVWIGILTALIVINHEFHVVTVLTEETVLCIIAAVVFVAFLAFQILNLYDEYKYGIPDYDHEYPISSAGIIAMTDVDWNNLNSHISARENEIIYNGDSSRYIYKVKEKGVKRYLI